MSPVSNAPLLAVNVCAVPSLFFTVILAPAFTDSVFGENARFLIETVGLLARGVVAPAAPTATTPRLHISNRAVAVAASRDATVRLDRVSMTSSMPQSRPSCARHRREHVVHHVAVLVLGAEQHDLGVLDDAHAVPGRPVEEVLCHTLLCGAVGVGHDQGAGDDVPPVRGLAGVVLEALEQRRDVGA